MIANRELGIDDYLAMARRRFTLILIPALLAPLVGFLISFALTPRYTSRSLLQVEAQVVPAGYVKPIITAQVSDRMTTLQQQVLSRNRLEPVVNRLGLARGGTSVDAAIEKIRDNLSVSPADPNAPPSGSSGANANSKKKKRPDQSDDVPGFYVSFTADNPRDAQQVCSEITSMLLKENLEVREQVAQSTTDFLARQVQQAKHNLDEMDNKLAAFKRRHQGQLPDDADSNAKILLELNSRLDGYTQTLNRAQEDKAYASALEAREMEAWKASKISPNLPPLRLELIRLQNQLVTLQSHYTEFHPDIVRTKNEIAKVKAELKESNIPETQGDSPTEAADKVEPPEILRLRLQIHQNEGTISAATREQKRLQDEIEKYESHLALSPEVEEEYKQLTRDNLTAHNLYDAVLTHEREAEMQTEMERAQEGEQLTLLNPADLPNVPSFPVRWQFAVYGLAAGVGLGVAIAMWLEVRDKSIRDEQDVLAGLELPMLGALSWAGEKGQGTKTRRRFMPSLG